MTRYRDRIVIREGGHPVSCRFRRARMTGPLEPRVSRQGKPAGKGCRFVSANPAPHPAWWSSAGGCRQLRVRPRVLQITRWHTARLPRTRQSRGHPTASDARALILAIVGGVTIHAHARDTASIRDVARLAEVSRQTVSRVLNGHTNVHPVTRQRVLDAVAELRFSPNRAARMLATNRSFTVGVLMTASPAYYGPSSIMSAVENAARDSGYSILLASPRDMDVAEFSAAVDHLIHEGVEGIVVVAPQIRAAEAMMKLREPVPVVMVQCDGADPGLSVNNEVGGELAAQHLWDLGHRRLALVAGPDDWSESGARRRGFEKYLASVGAGPVAVTDGDWSAASGYHAFGRIADADFTGAFCANDQMALGFIHAAFDRLINVPADLSVVGFDDIPEAAHYLPPLTTVHQDFDALGRRAVDSLLSAMERNTNGSEDLSNPLHPQLIVRKSTASTGQNHQSEG